MRGNRWLVHHAHLPLLFFHLVVFQYGYVFRWGLGRGRPFSLAVVHAAVVVGRSVWRPAMFRFFDSCQVKLELTQDFLTYLLVNESRLDLSLLKWVDSCRHPYVRAQPSFSVLNSLLYPPVREGRLVHGGGGVRGRAVCAAAAAAAVAAVAEYGVDRHPTLKMRHFSMVIRSTVFLAADWYTTS